MVDVVAVVVAVGRDIDMGGGSNGGGDGARIDIVDVLFFLPSISLSVMFFFCCCCTDEEKIFFFYPEKQTQNKQKWNIDIYLLIKFIVIGEQNFLFYLI